MEASSAFGIDGTVTIDSPDVEITSGITLLTGAFIDAAALLRAPCAVRVQVRSSSLSVAGRSGLPVGPDTYLPSPNAPAPPLPDSMQSSKPGAAISSQTAPAASLPWAQLDSDCSG